MNFRRSKTEEQRRKAGVNATRRRAPGACGTEMRATAATTDARPKQEDIGRMDIMGPNSLQA